MKKNIVITGANRGIGLSLTKHYQQQGHQVFGSCRNSSAELDASGAMVIDGIDVSNDASIAQLSAKLNGTEIDLLINNAGIFRNEVLGNIDHDSIQKQFTVNTFGPLKITEALHNYFSENSKLVMITSRMGSISDNTNGGFYGYRMSKAALNIAAISLSHDLRQKRVSVAIIHPGFVGTDMISGYGDGDITPDQAAERIAQRIEELNLKNSGTFWHSNGQVLPW